MPGRSPAEAVEAFLSPLREAISCLGTAHLTLTPGARGDTEKVHQWVLNDDSPMEVDTRYSLRSSMHFKVSDDRQAPAARRFKVTTLGYMHSVFASGQEMAAFHWHPESSSSWTSPHMHIGTVALSDSGVFPTRAHIPTPRSSLESVVRWMITELEVDPKRKDWEEILDRTESTFDQYKSWGT